MSSPKMNFNDGVFTRSEASTSDKTNGTAGDDSRPEPAEAFDVGEPAESDSPAEQLRKSQASRLVELVHAQNVELFHDDDRAYASRAVSGHRETCPTNSRAFRNFLARAFYQAERSAPSHQAVGDALATLDGQALYAGPQREVHVRVAELRGKIYLDLGDKEWTVVEISVEGWRVVKIRQSIFGTRAAWRRCRCQSTVVR